MMPSTRSEQSVREYAGEAIASGAHTLKEIVRFVLASRRVSHQAIHKAVKQLVADDVLTRETREGHRPRYELSAQYVQRLTRFVEAAQAERKGFHKPVESGTATEGIVRVPGELVGRTVYVFADAGRARELRREAVA